MKWRCGLALICGLWTGIAYGASTPVVVPASGTVGVSVGAGWAEASARQVVRTAGNVVYVITSDDTACQSGGRGTITVRKGSGSQALNAQVPTTFTEMDGANRPTATNSGSCVFDPSFLLSSPDSRLDPSGIIHMAYVDGNRNVYYQTFSTVTDTWGARVVLSSNGQVQSEGWARSVHVALTLDVNNVPHVLFATNGSSNAIQYTNKVSGSWSAPTTLASGTYQDHPSMVTALDGSIHATWLDNAHSTSPNVKYAKYSGSWGSVETVASGVMGNGDNDQGPSIATDLNNLPHVLYLVGAVLGADDYVRLKYRTAGGVWTDNTPSGAAGASNPNGTWFTHTPQNYISKSGNEFVMLAHNAALVPAPFQYQVGGVGNNWSAVIQSDTTQTADGSASIRFDPLRDNNPKIVDYLYYKENDGTGGIDHHGMVYYKALDISGMEGYPWSGIIDPSRAIDWSQAGVVGGIPSATWTQCGSTIAAGATAATVQAAVTACTANHYVLLGPGAFSFSTGISMKTGVVLRGSGADQTLITFTGSGGSCGAAGGSYSICFAGSWAWSGAPGSAQAAIQPGGSNAATWTAGFTQGTTQITLTGVGSAGISVGQYILLDQANDTADTGNLYVCDNSCSAQGGSGGRYLSVDSLTHSQTQAVKVTAINGSTYTISPGLYAANWSSAKHPGAWWGTPITNSGIENLSLTHRSSTGFSSSGAITMAGAFNCWVKGVRSIHTTDWRNHIWIFESGHNTVQDSYFYGSNGASLSYGIETRIATDDLLVNNIFHKIASGVMMGTVTGDVAAYNFSVNDYYNPGAGSQYLSPAHWNHDAGTLYNLLEGNYGPLFRADIIHGGSGMSTLFRNRYYGWEMSSYATKTAETESIIFNSFNRFENVVGNVLGRTGYHTTYQQTSSESGNHAIFEIGTGDCCDSGSVVAADPKVLPSTLRWGNFDTVNNAVRWVTAEIPTSANCGAPCSTNYSSAVPASQTLPASFYSLAKPTWWPATKAWPPLGPEVTGGNVGVCTGGSYDGMQAIASSQCTGGTLSATVGGRAYSIPAMDCFLSTMGGRPDGGEASALTFNAATCYAPQGGGTAPTITTASLPGGTVGTAYSQTLTATGDTPITWTLASGTLPTSLNLSSAGVISGTPTVANTFNFSVQATNATGTATNGPKALSIVVAVTPAPAVTITPATSHDFGNQTTNTTSANFAFTVTNSGTADLHITTLTNGGTNAADFADSGTCAGSTLIAGNTCTINTTFTPSAIGARSGTVSIADDASGSPQVITLTGTGTAPLLPVVSLAPASLTFTAQTLGTPSAAQTLTLQNTGNATLNITSIVASGDYSRTTTCGATLAATVSCTISVTFTPSATGTRAGTIVVTDNAAGSPHSVALTGTGTPKYTKYGRGAMAGTFRMGGVVAGGGGPSIGENAYCSSSEVASFGATDGPATLPTSCINTVVANTPSPGTVRTATNCADIATKLSSIADNSGDTLVIPAAFGVCEGHWTVTYKGDAAHWLTIRTDQLANLPEGTQATPCLYGLTHIDGYPDFACPTAPARLGPTLSSNATNTTTLTITGSYVRIIGLDITKDYGVNSGGQLVNLQYSDHVILDRYQIHGDNWDLNPPNYDTHVGVNTKGTYQALINGWIYDIDWGAADGYGIGGGTGNQKNEGPIKIYNNLVAGGSENFIFGGGAAVAWPSDYEIRRNIFMKPWKWMNSFYGKDFPNYVNVKNCIEYKHGHRVLLEENVLENNWEGQADQAGYCVVVLPKNQASVIPAVGTAYVNTNGHDIYCAKDATGALCDAGTGLWADAITSIARTSGVVTVTGSFSGYGSPPAHVVLQGIPSKVVSGVNLNTFNGEHELGCLADDVTCSGSTLYFDSPGTDFAATDPGGGLVQNITASTCAVPNHCHFSAPKANYSSDRVQSVISAEHITTIEDEGLQTGITMQTCHPGLAPNAQVQDFTARYNYISHSENIGFNIGNVSGPCLDQTMGVSKISIHDNLADDIDVVGHIEAPASGHGGSGPIITNTYADPTLTPHDISIVHNTWAGTRAYSSSYTTSSAFEINDPFNAVYQVTSVKRVSNVVTLTMTALSSVASQYFSATLANFTSPYTAFNGTQTITGNSDTTMTFTLAGADINPAVTLTGSETASVQPPSYYANFTARDNIFAGPVRVSDHNGVQLQASITAGFALNLCQSGTCTWFYKNNIAPSNPYPGYANPSGAYLATYPTTNPDGTNTCTIAGGCAPADLTAVFTNWGTGRGIGDTSANDYTVKAAYKGTASDGKDPGADITHINTVKAAVLPHFTYQPLVISTTSLTACTHAVYCEQQLLISSGASGQYGWVMWHLTGGTLPTGMSLSTFDQSSQTAAKVNGAFKTGCTGSLCTGSAGWIWGTPTQTGSFPLTFESEDAAHQKATKTLTLVVN